MPFHRELTYDEARFVEESRHWNPENKDNSAYTQMFSPIEIVLINHIMKLEDDLSDLRNRVEYRSDNDG